MTLDRVTMVPIKPLLIKISFLKLILFKQGFCIKITLCIRDKEDNLHVFKIKKQTFFVKLLPLDLGLKGKNKVSGSIQIILTFDSLFKIVIILFFFLDILFSVIFYSLGRKSKQEIQNEVFLCTFK